MPSRILIFDSRQLYDGYEFLYCFMNIRKGLPLTSNFHLQRFWCSTLPCFTFRKSCVRHSFVSPSKGLANFKCLHSVSHLQRLLQWALSSFPFFLYIVSSSIGALSFTSDLSMAASHFSKDISNMRMFLSDMHSKDGFICLEYNLNF